MILGIRKAKGTLGTFDELRELFTEHAIIINEVTTTSSEANKISNERIDAAFESAKQAIIFERAKRQIREEAKQGVIDPTDVIPDININRIKNEGDRQTLKKLKIQEDVQHAKTSILNYAKSIKDNREKDFFKAIVEFMEQTRTQWRTLVAWYKQRVAERMEAGVDNVHGS